MHLRGNLAEVLIVSGRRGYAKEMTRIVDELPFDIVSVTPAAVRRCGEAYSCWGKGVHRQD